MGLNIKLIKILEITTEETWGGNIPYYNYENLDWFDSLRHSGDNEFVNNNEFEYIDLQTDLKDREIRRPKDLEKTKIWIKNNIELESNKNRLLKSINAIENDDSIGFIFCY